jgi:integrase
VAVGGARATGPRAKGAKQKTYTWRIKKRDGSFHGAPLPARAFETAVRKNMGVGVSKNLRVKNKNWQIPEEVEHCQKSSLPAVVAPVLGSKPAPRAFPERSCILARPRKLPENMRVRGGVYYADFYDVNGRRVRKRLSSDFDAAREILNDLKARADKAEHGLLDNDYALDQMREEFIRHSEQTVKPATADRYETCLTNILPRLGTTRACQIRHENVEAYREERKVDGACPRTINMEVGVLATMFRWATSPNVRLIATNPLAGLKPLRHDHAKNGRPLTDDEVGLLLKDSLQPWRDIWYAYLVTGMRKAELAGLFFTDVDWENREIIVRADRAKNHRQRRIPIDAGLWEILCRQRDGREARRPGKGVTTGIAAQVQARFSQDHVFVTTQNTPLTHRACLHKAFMRSCDRAGIQTRTVDADGREIDHLDVHSLRRTFATNLITAGADPKSVQELLGHRTLDMTMRLYAKIHSGTKRQALGRLSYGQGTVAPDHVLSYPGSAGFPVQNGHRMVTNEGQVANA